MPIFGILMRKFRILNFGFHKHDDIENFTLVDCSTLRKISFEKLLSTQNCMYKKDWHHDPYQDDLIFCIALNIINSSGLEPSNDYHK